MIPYGRQEITEADIDAVVRVLRSDALTQGPVVPEFERAVARYCGAEIGVAMNSATSALHLACLALGLGPGDLVWTSPVTFVASANCARYCGADVDFVDIDPRSYNLSADALEEKLRRAADAGRLPKIVIPVHLCGQSCDMRRIKNAADEFGVKVIEDASHAIGGQYRGDPIGSCRYSDITVFSFHPVKIITTGEGGMAMTNNLMLGERMRRLRSHGITRDLKEMTHPADGPWYYQQLELGFNYRMTDIQGALGLSQLDRLDEYVRRRHALAGRYDDLLAGLPVTIPWRDPLAMSAFHLYVIRVPSLGGISRGEAFSRLLTSKVGVNVHYIPVHLQPYYRAMGFRPGQFPESEQYYLEAITLPLYPALSFDMQDEVVAAVRTAIPVGSAA